MAKINANYFLRHFEARYLLETLFVFSVASALVMRGSLALLDYPQLSTSELHIAHVLFGGLFMLIALVVAIVFLNKETRYVAASLGGIGFGLFIDELGKFITHDNNYFFEPAYALIYLTFIVMFFAFRFVAYSFHPSRNEQVFNALELLKESVIHEMDAQEKKAALIMLDQMKEDDELVQALKQVIDQIEPRAQGDKRWLVQVREWVLQTYRTLVARNQLIVLIVWLFVVFSMIQLGWSVWFVTQEIGFWQVGFLISSSLVALLMVLGGAYLLRYKLLAGYAFVKQGVLVSLLLVRFFQFYFLVPLALLGVLLDVLMVGVLNYIIGMESEQYSLKDESRVEEWMKQFVKLVMERPIGG